MILMAVAALIFVDAGTATFAAAEAHGKGGKSAKGKVNKAGKAPKTGKLSKAPKTGKLSKGAAAALAKSASSTTSTAAPTTGDRETPAARVAESTTKAPSAGGSAEGSGGSEEEEREADEKSGDQNNKESSEDDPKKAEETTTAASTSGNDEGSGGGETIGDDDDSSNEAAATTAAPATTTAESDENENEDEADDDSTGSGSGSGDDTLGDDGDDVEDQGIKEGLVGGADGVSFGSTGNDVHARASARAGWVIGTVLIVAAVGVGVVAGSRKVLAFNDRAAYEVAPSTEIDADTMGQPSLKAIVEWAQKNYPAGSTAGDIGSLQELSAPPQMQVKVTESTPLMLDEAEIDSAKMYIHF